MAYDRRARGAEPVVPREIAVDYRREVGRVFVPVDVPRGFVVLDPVRAAVLRAWTSALIPARGARPAAGEVGAAEYIDATAHRAPLIRAGLLAAIDAIEREARVRSGVAFADAEVAAQTNILRDLEASRHGAVFAMVRDLTYEAYYAHPRVLDALEAETGWRYANAFAGSRMEPFDETLLARMKALPPRYRTVGEG
jgi:gluconate 2-dehydrogenase subunit 3-like protein